jgi:quinol-cytochrome oxidoreductase complex cytochrome b subunit
MLGAPEVGERALLRFYVLHVYVLPALLTMLLAVHVWRVRKDGFAGGEPVAEPRAAVAEPDREGDGDGR